LIKQEYGDSLFELPLEVVTKFLKEVGLEGEKSSKNKGLSRQSSQTNLPKKHKDQMELENEYSNEVEAFTNPIFVEKPFDRFSQSLVDVTTLQLEKMFHAIEKNAMDKFSEMVVNKKLGTKRSLDYNIIPPETKQVRLSQRECSRTEYHNIFEEEEPVLQKSSSQEEKQKENSNHNSMMSQEDF